MTPKYNPANFDDASFAASWSASWSAVLPSGSDLVTIEWTAPADANAPALTGYRVYKSTDGGTTYSLLDTVGAVLTADVDAVAGNKIYVAAYNDAGENPKDATDALALGEIITII